VVFLRHIILACAAAVALCFLTGASVLSAQARPGATSAARTTQRVAAIRWLGSQVYAYQRATWHWQQTMGVRRTPTAGRVLTRMSIPDVESAVRLWKHRAKRARRRAQHPPHLSALLCIHRYEGSWTDAGEPYFGGLQMDRGFQARYGTWLYRHKGTADRWTPLEQIWTAERAVRSRGFWPWPNTARACGLI
jgi:hypothetical protein